MALRDGRDRRVLVAIQPLYCTHEWYPFWPRTRLASIIRLPTSAADTSRDRHTALVIIDITPQAHVPASSGSAHGENPTATHLFWWQPCRSLRPAVSMLPPMVKSSRSSIGFSSTIISYSLVSAGHDSACAVGTVSNVQAHTQTSIIRAISIDLHNICDQKS